MKELDNFAAVSIYFKIMTLLEFAQSRNLDWAVVYDYLKTSGAYPLEDPNWVIERDWLEELRKEFTIAVGDSEEERQLDEVEKDLFDEETQKRLDEEKANLILGKEYLDISQIDVDPKQLTLDIIIRRLENDEIDLDPEFQRGKDLWDDARQSKLIESILIKLPLPTFYFDGGNDERWAVVDGLQRLSSIKKFAVDKKLRLSNLDFLGHLEGKGYDDLPRPLHRRIQETIIFAFLIKPGTPKNLKYNIFRRINTGGLILSPQEIRHAIHPGVPAQLLKHLSELDIFHQATGYSLKSNLRMVDRDYINRFVAFYLRDYSTYGKKDKGENNNEGMDGFLNKSMEDINETNKDEITEKFKQAMETALGIFGSDAFRKRYEYPPKKPRRNPLNKALFETWAVNLAKLSEADCSRLIQQREVVMELSSKLLSEDKVFDVSITYGTGDVTRVRYRFGEVGKLIKTILATT